MLVGGFSYLCGGYDSAGNWCGGNDIGGNWCGGNDIGGIGLWFWCGVTIGVGRGLW